MNILKHTFPFHCLYMCMYVFLYMWLCTYVCIGMCACMYTRRQLYVSVYITKTVFQSPATELAS